MGFVRSVENGGTDGLWREAAPTDVLNLKRDGMPEEIRKVCQEYAALIPSDLPKGLQLV